MLNSMSLSRSSTVFPEKTGPVPSPHGSLGRVGIVDQGHEQAMFLPGGERFAMKMTPQAAHIPVEKRRIRLDRKKRLCRRDVV